MGYPDPGGMKLYAPAGDVTFDGGTTTEDAHARADRCEAACRTRV